MGGWASNYAKATLRSNSIMISKISHFEVISGLEVSTLAVGAQISSIA
jgi:hypothetical protein